MKHLISSSKPTARSLALQVLLEGHRHQAFVSEILDKHLNWSSLSPADRRLATQLVYGVLRRRGTLDAFLKTAVTRPRDRVEPWLWETLRLGVYQLALLSHIPPHAAIFETVELASFVGKPRGKGFLNGVLRKVASLLTVDFTEAPGVDALPLSSLPPLYRRLSQPILPDPATHPAEYLATGFSWPVWLAKRWLTRYGWEECVRLGFWFSGPAPLYLRCNPLQIDRTMVLQSLTEAQVQTEAGQHEQSLKLIENVAIPTLPGFSRGWFTVQDESAMWVGSTLAPQPGMRVLDLCAAPGGKTTHLAELMQNQGQIIACDMDATRLQTVSDLCERLGITIVEPCLLNPSTHEEPPPGPFDAILVDVPCSNTGVLGRRPEVRWRLKPGEFQHLVRLQTKLLLQAGERIRSGGHIVYSTCSIEPEENQQVFQVVLRGMSDLVLEQEKIQIPGQPADGGYWACYRRK